MTIQITKTKSLSNSLLLATYYELVKEVSITEACIGFQDSFSLKSPNIEKWRKEVKNKIKEINLLGDEIKRRMK